MITAITTVIIFLVMISIHEFGHFITAKAVGVKVLEFSIGMGPAVFKKQGEETLYSVRILPIGGFCRLEGENEETSDPRAFCNQKLSKRFLVIVSGAVLNIILGTVLFSVRTAVYPNITGTESSITYPVIENTVENSYAASSGLLPGDRITRINGHRIYYYDDIALYTDKFKENEPAEIEIRRGKEKMLFSLLPSVSETLYLYNNDSVTVKNIINGKETGATEHSYTDNEAQNIKPYIGTTSSQKRLIIGFTPKSEKVNAKNIIPYSVHFTGFAVRLVYKALWDMITGAEKFSEISGPVGIVSAVNTAVSTGSYMIINVLYLAAFLTINLGVINLLPIPALDGGRLFFMLIELFRGKPVPQDKEGLVHAVGLAVLLGLTLIISFNDIIKLIK